MTKSGIQIQTLQIIGRTTTAFQHQAVRRLFTADTRWPRCRTVSIHVIISSSILFRKTSKESITIFIKRDNMVNQIQSSHNLWNHKISNEISENENANSVGFTDPPNDLCTASAFVHQRRVSIFLKGNGHSMDVRCPVRQRRTDQTQ